MLAGLESQKLETAAWVEPDTKVETDKGPVG